jgi:hypothetical protein
MNCSTAEAVIFFESLISSKVENCEAIKSSQCPEYILDALKPKKIILGHWEDFMASQFSTLDEINDSKKLTASAVEQFIKRIDNYNQKNGTNIEYIVPMLWKNYNFKLNDNSKIQ